MEELEVLGALLGALYLFECLVWVRRGGVAWSAPAMRRWVSVTPSLTFGNRDGGYVLSMPLPPLGITLLSEAWPLSVSPEGILGFASHAQGAPIRPQPKKGFLPFAEIRTVEARDKALFVNGERFVETSSRALAAHLARLVDTLARASAAERARKIEEAMNASVDPDAVLRRIAELRAGEKRVRVLSNALFVHLAVVCPLVGVQFGFAQPWPFLVVPALALIAALVVEFRRAHARLHGEDREARLKHGVLIALSPLAALRACDALARECVARFHPLAVARAVCDPQELRAFARKVVLDARHPVRPPCPWKDEASTAAERWHRERLLAALERRLRDWGLDPAELAAPPRPEDSLQRSYCPRCEGQFVIDEGRCIDCGGLPLAAF